MRYSTFLLGAFASLGLVHAFAAPEAVPEAWDDESDWSDEFTDCEESGPVSSLIPASSHFHHHSHPPPPASITTTTTTTTKHHHHHPHPFPIITKTVIVIVEEFTRFCTGPTTISEGTVTVTVTEPCTVTFSTGGPFTLTKTILECFTTTTEYFFEEDCGCKGWPYASGHGFTPLVIPETAYPTNEAFTTEWSGSGSGGSGSGNGGGSGSGNGGAGGNNGAAGGTSYPKAPVVTGAKAAGAAGASTAVFTGMGSRMATGLFGVVAGVVAIMVL